MSEVHGHEVMHMMAAARHGFTRESLRAAIEARFGTEARFYTCSAQGMTADQLIDFLAARNKFVPADEGAFAVDPARICDH